MNYYDTLKCGRSINDEIETLKEDIASYKLSMAKGKFNAVTHAFVRRMKEHAQKDLNNILFHLREPREGDITEADIEKARNYPVDALVEFNSMGRALAWCHSDSEPSLSFWKGHNSCRCFVCGKSFDSIAILMERDKMSFINAVKQLR